MTDQERLSQSDSSPLSRNEDSFTMSAKLCDDDGIVRGGPMWKGTDYPCTGHAHFAGEHIRCSGPSHPGELPADLLAALQDPSIVLPGDQAVYETIARYVEDTLPPQVGDGES